MIVLLCFYLLCHITSFARLFELCSSACFCFIPAHNSEDKRGFRNQNWCESFADVVAWLSAIVRLSSDCRVPGLTLSQLTVLGMLFTHKYLLSPSSVILYGRHRQVYAMVGGVA